MTGQLLADDVWEVPGQDRAVSVLRSAVARGEVSHAWAFLGDAGVGQEEAARALVAALNCPEPDAPCGRCASCRRAVRGVHPAYREFAPTGAMHRVDDVRGAWTQAATRTAAEGRWKVLRVVEAERMNDAAANAFLKILEEPPPTTVWILDVADPDELPDTILSRCREVRFVPWTRRQLDDEARRLGLGDAHERALAVRASLGSPQRLRRLAAPGGLDDFRAHRSILGELREQGPAYALVAARLLDEEVKRAAATVKGETKTELADLAEYYAQEVPRSVAKQVEDRGTRREREARTAVIQAALDDLVAWCRDCLVVATGGTGDAIVSSDVPERLRADADALGPARLLRAIDRLLDTRESLEANVQQGLALEAVFLQLSSLLLER